MACLNCAAWVQDACGNLQANPDAQALFSRKYNGAPMPYSVFFYKGYAIHGTDVVKRLGAPASHGCVRLHPKNAKRLFSLIQANGPSNAKIVIVK